MNDWFQVEQIDDDIYAICEDLHWERTRSYLFTGEHTAFLIDSGTGICNMTPLVHTLTQLPVKVLTTHVHWDHIGNHHRFADVSVHAVELDWMQQGIPLPVALIRQQIMTEPFPMPADCAFDIENYVPPTVTAPKALMDGMFLSNGRHEFEILHTPGHSPGSICLFEKTRRILLSGDLLYRGTIYANYPSTDPQLVNQSLLRLSQIPGPLTILPGHNDSTLDRHILDEAVSLLAGIAEQHQLVHGSGLHTGTTIGFFF